MHLSARCLTISRHSGIWRSAGRNLRLRMCVSATRRAKGGAPRSVLAALGASRSGCPSVLQAQRGSRPGQCREPLFDRLPNVATPSSTTLTTVAMSNRHSTTFWPVQRPCDTRAPRPGLPERAAPAANLHDRSSTAQVPLISPGCVRRWRTRRSKLHRPAAAGRNGSVGGVIALLQVARERRYVRRSGLARTAPGPFTRPASRSTAAAGGKGRSASEASLLATSRTSRP